MKPIVIDGPRMSDISEWSEAFYLKGLQDRSFEKGYSILGVHLWTHSPRRFRRNPIVAYVLERFQKNLVPCSLQITVTGLGGTFLEPGIETTEESFFHIQKLIKDTVIPPHRITLRIDPLQSWKHNRYLLTNLEKVHHLLERAHALGIHKIRISLIDFHTYKKKILPRMARMDLQYLPLDPSEVALRFRPWIEKGIDIRTCATDLTSQGIPSGACFDFAWVTGIPLSEERLPVAPRIGCLCYYPQDVTLWKIPRRSCCPGRCVACYAQEHG
jgi:hypothetical protein